MENQNHNRGSNEKEDPFQQAYNQNFNPKRIEHDGLDSGGKENRDGNINPFKDRDDDFDKDLNKKWIEESNKQYYISISQCNSLDNSSQGRLVSNILLNLIESLEKYLLKIARIDYIDTYFDWDFHLLESSFVNAFCMPGGKVLVYSGILTIADNEEKIAYILAHELAHALLNHPRDHIIVKDRDYNNVLLFRPFSKAQEMEADRLSMMILKWADYDIAKIPSFCELVKSNDNSFNYFSTHPLDDERIGSIRALVDEISSQRDDYYAPIIIKENPYRRVYENRYAGSNRVSGSKPGSNRYSGKSASNRVYGSKSSSADGHVNSGNDYGSSGHVHGRSDVHNKILCPNCGFYEDSDASFCSNCGYKLNSKLRCKRCGAIIGSDDLFCTNCGNVLVDDLRCFNCGERIKPGDVFCVNCGIKLIR